MIRGFQFSAVRAGLKRKGNDMALLYAPRGCVTAAVFTTNRFCAAPVILDRERVRRGNPRAVVVNSGNANACTGQEGLRNARRVTADLARRLGVRDADVLISSTGIIGHQLPVDKLLHGLPGLVAGLSPQRWRDAAGAILTTDAFPKLATATCRLNGKKISVMGFAKGAGMIHPKMATMLAYIFTDAAVRKPVLQALTSRVAERTFNAIVVDGDTSTNDTLLVMASGMAGNRNVTGAGSTDAKKLAAAIEAVARKLALLMVKDGEGATRMMEVTVTGAPGERAAKQVAKSVAQSQLVQCALFGGDPNWGRIIAAVGYSGVVFNPDRVSIWIEKKQVVKNGGLLRPPHPKSFMKPIVHCEIRLNAGKDRATVWFSDLTHRYVDVNSAYHT